MTYDATLLTPIGILRLTGLTDCVVSHKQETNIQFGVLLNDVCHLLTSGCIKPTLALHDDSVTEDEIRGVLVYLGRHLVFHLQSFVLVRNLLAVQIFRCPLL